MSTTTYSPLELIDVLKDILENKEEFNFSILVEMQPIKKKFTYVCKILSIITKSGSNKAQIINYDKILEHELNYIEIKENHTRKIGNRKTPFWIDGSSVIQEFKGNQFIDYSLRNPTKIELRRVDKLRIKYQISAPRIFVGQKLTFDDESLEDEI
jgi:hypothetical protein